MTTLEDAADALVVRLRALDTEIEESQGQIEALRTRVEAAAADVEQEWTALDEAVTSFVATAGEEATALDAQAGETLQGVGEAHQGVATDGPAAHSEVDQGGAQLDALGQHATTLEGAVDSLAAQAGESPAQALAGRVHELEAELAKVADDVRDFLQDDVATAAEQVATEVRELCEELHRTLAEEMTQALQKAYDEWEGHVDELEEYFATKGFAASHQHATDAVEYVVEEWGTRSTQQADELQRLAGVLVSQLQELAAHVSESAQTLVEQVGDELSNDLERARQSAATAVAALDQARQVLASYNFMEA